MPKVGKKHFAYTPAGKEAAAAEASATGVKVERGYAKGSSVKGSKKKSKKRATTSKVRKVTGRRELSPEDKILGVPKYVTHIGKKIGEKVERGIKGAGKTLKSESKKTKKTLKKVESKTKKDLKKSGKVLEESLRSGLKKSFSKGGSVKAPKGYVVARGSGAARPQYFKVNT